MGTKGSAEPTKPPREEDELQPGPTSTPGITRDITGETHVEPAPDSSSDTQIHIVREGDTPASISRRYYGDERQWRRILDANRDRIGAEDELEVGTQLRIPPAE